MTRKGGIYEYLLSGGEQERALSIRKFTDSQKRDAYERQGGRCADCGRHFEFEKCTAITGFRGPVAATPCPTTCRCCAARATSRRATDEGGDFGIL